jgi:8-oxo-dGTP pyrophosphatase MutT (NUDIX family)
VTTPAPREAARVILLDPGNRVMLLRYDENGGFWATPGGSLEPGETHPQAVIRELREELGIQHVTLGPHLATRTKEHPVAGRPVRQAERYYLARIPAEAVQPGAATQTDNIRESRWWTLAEMTSTRQTIYPTGLSDLLQAVLTEGPPEQPATLN